MNEKKNIKFLDPQIKIKNKTISNRLQFIPDTNIPLPSEIEISESGMCNRKCSFCPRSDPKYKEINEFISYDLHKKLCDQLKEVNFSGLIIYSGFVEPLLDKNIYNLINYAKLTLPRSNVEIISNGDVLNEKRLKKLYDAGLDKIQISLYDGEEQHNKFIELGKKLKLDDNKFVLRARYLPEEKNFGITLSNRGGMLENAGYKIMPTKKKLNEKCFYPGYKFFMDYNGDVLMCSHDWGKKNILGNLNKNTFLEIWLNEKSSTARKKLFSSDRSLKPCNVCDVTGDLIGKTHFEAWEKNGY